jgi:PTH1 family peptidyl-tRNA hydrolase
MHCLLGLGNPGPEYAETRHNLGFAVLEALVEKHQVKLRSPWLQPYRWGQIRLHGEEVMLVQPLSYMNNSGRVAARLVNKFGLTPQEILVVYDDLDLDLGRLRMRRKGGAGTHNGMRSLVEELDTEEFPRLRMGIGPVPRTQSAREFVLSPFKPDEKEAAAEMVITAVQAVELYLREGVQVAMNWVNAQ